MKEVLQLLLHPLMWLSSRDNRMRLRGARVEVVAFILCRKPEPSILLGKSAFGEIWMPPQEGVNLGERHSEALWRCLDTECGLGSREEDPDFARRFYLRSIRYVGMLELPKDRKGERAVADNAVGTPLEHILLKRKAYWMATLLVRNQSEVSPVPDGNELTDLRWFSLQAARQAIIDSNRWAKAQLILKGLDMCRRDVMARPESEP